MSSALNAPYSRRRTVSINANGNVPRRGGLGSIVRNSFFTYVQNITFTANETQSFTIQIQTDAHFMLVSAAATASTLPGAGGAAITQPEGGSLYQLRDSSGQRLLSSAPVALNNLFGTAQRPFVLPYTHIFRAGGGIGIDATGNTGAAQTVRLAFHGFKVPIGSVPWLDTEFRELAL
jgi:hypothetical protein